MSLRSGYCTQQRLYSIDAKYSGVFRRKLQTVQSFFDRSGRDPRKLRRRFPEHPLCQCRTRGDRRRAASYLIPDLGNTSVLEARSEAQHVATGRIPRFYRHGWRIEFANIARILKMFKKTFRM